MTTLRGAVAGSLMAVLGACSAAGMVEGGSSTGGSASGVGTSTVGLSNGSTTAAATGTSGAATSSSGSSGSGGTTTGGNDCTGKNCPTGWGCIDDQCCALPCNGVCCPQPSEQVCATVSGVTQCIDTCTQTSRCPSDAHCCIVIDAGVEGCVPEGTGNGECICTADTDCDAGGQQACCAPATDLSGNPVGPYVCKPNDGESYDCCYGATNFCSSGTCCIKDGVGNEFCATPCASASDCQDSSCQNYTFSFFTTTCDGPTACGPQ